MANLVQSVVLIAAFLLPAPAAERTQVYRKRTLAVKPLCGQVWGASVSHLRNTPHEWSHGPAGFAKRLGSGFGEHAVRNTIAYGVAGLRHEDLRYYRSGKRGFGPRMKSALLATVVTRRTTTGKRTVAAGRVSGNLGAGLISRAWQPAGLRTGLRVDLPQLESWWAPMQSAMLCRSLAEIRHPRRHAYSQAHPHPR